jgi:hypothetical protein
MSGCFTRIRSFRSTTFARAYARANVVRGRPLAERFLPRIFQIFARASGQRALFSLFSIGRYYEVCIISH